MNVVKILSNVGVNVGVISFDGVFKHYNTWSQFVIKVLYTVALETMQRKYYFHTLGH